MLILHVLNNTNKIKKIKIKKKKKRRGGIQRKFKYRKKRRGGEKFTGMGPRKFWGNSKRKTLKPKEPLKIYLLCSRHPWKQKKRGPPSFWTGDKSESPVGS
jgi:hypothetical protein